MTALKTLTLALLLALPACGDDDAQFKSGNCGFDVISDYNSVVFACGSFYRGSCPDKKKQFLDKYPGVNCTASEGSGLDKHNVQITASRVNAL